MFCPSELGGCNIILDLGTVSGICCTTGGIGGIISIGDSCTTNRTNKITTPPHQKTNVSIAPFPGQVPAEPTVSAVQTVPVPVPERPRYGP